MATTQEYYRLQGRNPRYVTELSSFANGMYVTNQTIPEGYTKSLINYDIDDTGSYIKQKKGRKKLQTLQLGSPTLGAVTLTDYLYAYNKEGDEVIDTVDAVLSYGLYNKISDITHGQTADINEAYYIADLTEFVDTNVYKENEDGDYEVMIEGDKYEVHHKNAWCLTYDVDAEVFNKGDNKDIGYLTARTISKAWAFDKPLAKDIGRPVATVLNNEMLAFVGAPIRYTYYPNNLIRSELVMGGAHLAKIKLQHNDNTKGYELVNAPIDIRELTITEASNTGYNIAYMDPYTFTDKDSSGKVAILGVQGYKDEQGTVPTFSPDLGEVCYIRVYYQYPNNVDIKLRVESLDLDSYQSYDTEHWKTEQDWTAMGKSGTQLWFRFIPESTNTLLRFVLRKGDDTTTESAFTYSINTDAAQYKNLKFYTFDLSTAKGMVAWQGCLGLYGVENADDTIFFSAVEDPGYFPYPYNRLTFENQVYAVYPYLDNLIVITADSIWLVQQGANIQSSIQKKIMTNINISELDACNVVILKDEIFFKNGNSFYVLKPNQYTSDASDLKKYINSTAISNLTENFTEEVVKMLNSVYKLTWQKYTEQYRRQIRFVDFDVVDNQGILKNEEVHYIYRIKPRLNTVRDNNKLEEDLEFGYVDLSLVYNTLTRAWRIYLTAIGDDTVAYNSIYYRNKKSGALNEFFCKHEATEDGAEIVVTEQSNELVDENVTGTDWQLSEEYNNYNFIDTGNVSLSNTALKRFRELQISIYSKEHSKIDFFTDFRVDGAERISATDYTVENITDKEDPEYGIAYIRPVEAANMYKYEDSTLGDLPDYKPYWYTDDDQISHMWQLDLSAFPDLDTINMKIELKGKGRRGSIQLLNTSLQRYELSSWMWVYRLMNGR